MTLDEALPIVEELGAIAGFPSWSQSAVRKIAEVMARSCRTPMELQNVVDSAVAEFPKWEGTGVPALRGIIDRIRGNDWQGFGGPPRKADCARCNDNGWLQDVGRFVRCHCEAAAQVEDNFLGRLEALAAKPKRVEPAPIKRASAEEIDAVLERVLKTRGMIQ